MKHILFLFLLCLSNTVFSQTASFNEEVKTVISSKYISHRSATIHSASDSKGNLWIANNFGLFIENSTSKRMDDEFSIEVSENFEGIFYDEFDNSLILPSNNRLLKVDIENAKTIEMNYLNLSEENRLLAVYFAEEFSVYVTQTQYVRIMRNSNTVISKNFELPVNAVSIDKTSRQIFISATDKTIFSINLDDGMQAGASVSVSVSEVYSHVQHHNELIYASSGCKVVEISPVRGERTLFEQNDCKLPTQFLIIDSRMLILHHSKLYVHSLGENTYHSVQVFDQTGREFDDFSYGSFSLAENNNLIINIPDMGVLTIPKEFLFNDQHKSLNGIDVSDYILVTPGYDDTIWISSLTGLSLADSNMNQIDFVSVAEEVTRMSFVSKVYLLPDQRNVLLVSQTEVFLYDTVEKSLERYYERKSNIIETAILDNGDLFILDGDAIYRKDYQNKTLIQFQSKMENEEDIHYVAAVDSEHVAIFSTTKLELYTRDNQRLVETMELFGNGEGAIYDISAKNGKFQVASDTNGVAVFEVDGELNLVNKFVYANYNNNAPFSAVGLIRQVPDANATWYLGSDSWVRMSHDTQIPVLLSKFYEHTRTRVVSVAETNQSVYFTDRNYIGKIPAKYVTDLGTPTKPNLSIYTVSTSNGFESRLISGNTIHLAQDEVLHSLNVSPSTLFSTIEPTFEVKFPGAQTLRTADNRGYVAAPNLAYGQSIIEITGIAGGLEVAPVKLIVHRDTPFMKSTLFLVLVITVVSLAVMFVAYTLISSYNRNAQLSKSLSLTQKCFSGTGLIQFAIDKSGTVLAKNLQAETTFGLDVKSNIHDLIDDDELSQKWSSAIVSVCNIGEWNGALKLKNDSSLLYNRLSLAPDTKEPVIVISMTPFENIVEGNSVADTYTRYRALLELYALERKSRYYAMLFRPIFNNKAKDVDMQALQRLLQRRKDSIFPNGYFSNMYDKDLGFILQGNNSTDLATQIVKIKQLIHSVCNEEAQLFCGGIQLSNSGGISSGEVLSKMDHQLQKALDNNIAFNFENSAIQKRLSVIEAQTISESTQQENSLRLEPIIEQSSGATCAMKVNILCNNFQTLGGHALSIDNCKAYLEKVESSLDEIAKASENKVMVIDIPFTFWVYEQDYCEQLFSSVDTKNYRHRIAFNIKYSGESYNLTFSDLLDKLELYACKVYVTLDLNDRYRFESVTDVRVDMCIVEMQQSNAYLSLLDGFTSFARLAGKDICLANTTTERDILLKNRGINYFIGNYFGQPVSLGLANTLHESNFAHLVNENRVKL